MIAPKMSSLPKELVLDGLLPLLDVRDLLALGLANKSFFDLTEDDILWKRRLKEDFNFSGDRTGRTSGWKVIYKGLRNPKIYVWGDEQGDGRLGSTLAKNRRGLANGVPYPIRLHTLGARFVNVVAGGWSFHALDSKGNLYVWGTLDGSVGVLGVGSFSASSRRAETPTKLQMPVTFKSISCGRIYSMALDAEGYVWNFLSWGRPYRLVTPLLCRSTRSSTPIQVECGWAFSSVLTESGDVYVWFPLEGRLSQKIWQHMHEMDLQENRKASRENGTIPCVTWDLEHRVYMLPALPALPNIDGHDQRDDELEVKLVKIAAMEESLIGLTNKGHVLKFDGLRSEQLTPRRIWTYLPFFSEWTNIREHPDMNIQLNGDERIHITHISAHFLTFAAYSVEKNSIVLIGKSDAVAETGPKIIPSLQNRGVISVVVGDHHNGALTEDGKLLTWGKFVNGALGLGDPQKITLGQPGGFANAAVRDRARIYPWVSPPEVIVPTEVEFGRRAHRPRNKFCVAVAAGGWHMGAFVLDLDDDTEDDDDDDEEPSLTLLSDFNRNTEEDDEEYMGHPGCERSLPHPFQ